MKKWFMIGITIGVVLGGVLALLSFNDFSQNSVGRGNYEFLNLSHGDFCALRINRHTGESWGLTSDGTWLKLTVAPGVIDPDEWLKQQHYQPERTN